MPHVYVIPAGYRNPSSYVAPTASELDAYIAHLEAELAAAQAARAAMSATSVVSPPQPVSPPTSHGRVPKKLKYPRRITTKTLEAEAVIQQTLRDAPNRCMSVAELERVLYALKFERGDVNTAKAELRALTPDATGLRTTYPKGRDGGAYAFWGTADEAASIPKS
jgi:hypothetical protein